MTVPLVTCGETTVAPFHPTDLLYGVNLCYHTEGCDVLVKNLTEYAASSWDICEPNNAINSTTDNNFLTLGNITYTQCSWRNMQCQYHCAILV